MTNEHNGQQVKPTSGFCKKLEKKTLCRVPIEVEYQGIPGIFGNWEFFFTVRENYVTSVVRGMFFNCYYTVVRGALILLIGH